MSYDASTNALKRRIQAERALGNERQLRDELAAARAEGEALRQVVQQTLDTLDGMPDALREVGFTYFPLMVEDCVSAARRALAAQGGDDA